MQLVLPAHPVDVGGVVVVVVVVVVVLAAALPGEMAAGEEDVQVRGGLGTMHPCTSTAVAVIVSEVPLFAKKFVWPMFSLLAPSCRLMHCTGQVSAM
jgi:hypothetical protein